LAEVKLAALTSTKADSFTGTMSLKMAAAPGASSTTGLNGDLSMTARFTEQLHPSLFADVNIGSLAASGTTMPGGIEEIVTPTGFYMKWSYLTQALHLTKPWVAVPFSSLSKTSGVDLSKGVVDPHPSKTGLRVKYNTLAKEVEQTLLDPGNTQTVRIKTTVVRPKVSTAQLAKKYPAVLIVDRGSFRLTLYKNLKRAKTYGIAVGQVGLDTPAGLYSIQNKAINPAWHVPNSDWAGALAGKVIAGDDPSNPIKARWMGIYDGVGVHGTSDDASIGSAASHGCIRMHVPDVEELYDEVPVGAPIYIA